MNAFPRIPEGAPVEQAGPLFILLHPRAARWTVLNATGLAVARLCDGGHTIDDIAAALAARYGQPVDAVRPHVAACVADLDRAGFLEGGPAAPERAEGDGAPPWQLHLYLTEQCNLRCRHCAVVDDARPRGCLSAGALRDLVDQAAEAGAEAIAFGGGEPLLRPELPELLEYAAGRTGTILATNAVALDEALARKLAALGTLVQVSIDGPTAEVHDAVRGRRAFERAWRGIGYLLDAGAGDRLALNVTMMRPNIGRVEEITRAVAERGVRNVRFMPVQRTGQAAKDWEELAPSGADYAAAYRALFDPELADGVAVTPLLLGLALDPPEDGMWCGLGRLLRVDAEGDIYPCSLFDAPEFRLGNVAEMTLAEALASEKLAELIAAVVRRKDEIEECRACAWRHFCQAGCAASAWLEHGRLDATDGLCGLRREMFRTLVIRHALERDAAHTAAGQGGPRFC